MIITAVLLHNDNLYSSRITLGQELSLGSHKKDTIQIPEFGPTQVSLKWKANGIAINAKKAYGFETERAPLDTVIVLNNQTKTALYLSSETSEFGEPIKLPYNCIVKVGRSEANDIVLKIPFVSGSHFVLKNEAGTVRVEDQGSTNGIYLNGRRVSIAKMKSGDILSIFSVQMQLINGTLSFANVGGRMQAKPLEDPQADSVTHASAASLRMKYRRSPRTQDQLPHEDIILASAPSKGQKYEKSRGMLTSLAGTGAMFAANMMTSALSPALLAARAASLVSPITSIASSTGANKRRKMTLEQYEAMRREKYGAYIDDQKARIESVAKVQRDILTKENPTPRECIDILCGLKRSFWERMPADRDFLDVRLGMGYENLCVNVKSRAESNGFQMEDDEIRELSEQIVEETRIVDNVPARLSLLNKNTVGFVGNREKTIRLVKNMLISLTTAHCFEDVRIVGIFDPQEQSRWESLKWLPHVWDDNRQYRTLAFDKENAHSLCDMFHDMLVKRREGLKDTSYGNQGAPRPFYIFVFGSKDLVEKEPIMRDLFLNTPAMGITSLFLFDDMYMLPNDCRCIVDVDNGPCVFDRIEANNKFYFTMDPATDEALWDTFARRMAAVELDGFAAEAGLPNGIGFLEGYGVQTVEQLDVLNRWNKAVPYKSLAAPIGKMMGDKDFYFDIHEKHHGPHGLVAGTTGSGKSELLQTWILSMALCYHPYDVSFVIIDYKGGGMANLLEPLPHVVGKITNIGSNISRSLISLQSEIKRRYAIFDRYGVNHIDKYQKLYKEGKAPEPLPHLIIVSDEFAELKKEEPEFMAGLISAARVGRSIGVHLVLATQKPGGVVDDQIQSNSRFRLCLKVQDANDSREMIKRPDAAKLTQAGRCYIRVGEDEYFDLFQSFWSGAPYFTNGNVQDVSENQVRIVDVSGRRIKTVSDRANKVKSDMDELTAIIRYIGSVAKQNGIQRLQGPWMPELPEVIGLDTLREAGCFDGSTWHRSPEWLKLPIGKYDAPKAQTQGTQYMDLASEGHYGIYGAPGTGKTTLLKSIVLSLGMHYTPRDVNIYILDCGGWSMSAFSGMPHVGGIALDGEEEKFFKFEKMIMQEFEARKRLFLQNAVSSLKAYRESVSEDMPAIVIAIDNIVPVFDLYPDLENLFVTIARDGATYGIYMIYTSNSTSGVRYKVLQNIRGAVAFELTDKGDYATVVGRLDGMTLPKVLGRAFYKGNPPMEFQAAMYMTGENDREKSLALKELTARMNAAWTGPRPAPIPVMPDTVSVDNMRGAYSIRTCIPMGMGCEDIRPAYVDLADNYSMLISGSMRSGKSAMLARIAGLVSSSFPETKLFVFDSKSASLQSLASGVHKYTGVGDDGAVGEMLAELVGYLNERKRSQNQARAIDGGSFDEKEFISRYEMLCIVIDDLKEFVDTVSDNNKNAMERICRMAQDLGVVVLCAGRMTDISKYNEIESLTRVIVGNQNGLVMNGTPAQHSYFQNNLKYTERDAEAGEGLSYMYAGGKCIKVKFMQ